MLAQAQVHCKFSTPRWMPSPTYPGTHQVKIRARKGQPTGLGPKQDHTCAWPQLGDYRLQEQGRMIAAACSSLKIHHTQFAASTQKRQQTKPLITAAPNSQVLVWSGKAGVRLHGRAPHLYRMYCSCHRLQILGPWSSSRCKACHLVV
jgi:hypothetical protein